jgi:D-psicose/D-tagatose/L-ribulose 3-epimerase
MRFGANTFIWESPFDTSRHLSLVEKVAGFGFDLLEVAVEDPALIDVEALQQAAARAGIGLIVCGAFGPDRNLASDDESLRQNSSHYLRALIDMAVAVGSPIVAGPMYSSVGKARLPSEDARAAEWQRAVDGLRSACAYAEERGVKLAMEALNRFETDMVNIAEQALQLCEDVGSPALGLHLDTFHMHLEERDSAAAIRLAGDRLFHFHACENDRGVPGRGQVHWRAVAEALHEIGYDGAVVIESFTPQVASIARAVCIWRPIAPDQDTIAREGLAFLKPLLSPSLPSANQS